MANPRRNSYSLVSNNQISENSSSSSNNNNPFQAQTLTSVKFFLKKPHAFPFLLSLFLLLTWVSLRLQHSAHFSSSPPHRQWTTTATTTTATSTVRVIEEDKNEDHKVNLVRFSSGFPSRITKDKRGWLLNPLSLALDAGIAGGAVNCASVHLGEIRPGGVRGNHRHHTCNETFLIWGAKTIFRLENNDLDRGYAEVTIGADEVAVAASPHGKAHALVNVDPVQTTYFMGCQDSIIDYSNSSSDFIVWKDL